MKKLLIYGIALTGLLLTSFEAGAQAINNIRINEILVFNENNYEDDYGHREGWIELFNSGFTTVDVGGCYLSIYRDGQGEKYLIPRGDPRTRIAPQGYLIFWAEGTATKGTFHTSFTLDKTGYVAFFSQGGRGEPISEVTYNVADQIPDVSIGYLDNASGTPVFEKLNRTTPLATNELMDDIPADEKFRRADPYGVTMAVTAMTVVFLALILLYLIFRTIGRFNVNLARKKEAAASAGSSTSVPVKEVKPLSGDMTGEELAAVGMALYQYENDLHDIESAVLTINNVTRAYSPWNSKIYGLRQTPERK